jgi:site-specific DNA recombinase
MRHKRSLGERCGNIPFGSRLAADGVHLAPAPEEQRILTQVRRLRATGLSLRKIAAELNRRGLRTRRGTAWVPQYVASAAADVAA